MNEFQCLACSGSKLSYEKWIKCRERILMQPTGHIEYVDQDINDADVLPVECRFICTCCGQPPMLHGECIVTEAELKDYLELTVDKRTEMQDEYEQKQEHEITNDDLEYPWSDKMLL